MTAVGTYPRRRLLELELQENGTRIRNLLQPQEQLLVLADYNRASGKDRLPSPLDTMSRKRKAIFYPVAIVLSVLFPDSPSLKHMFGGVAVEGQRDSWAFRLNRASSGPSSTRGRHLLVTDRRLLLASSTYPGKDPEYAVALEIPRNALADAAVEGRPFTRGRVVLRFTDGSMIALDLGTWRTGPARSFVQALTAPGTVAAPPG